jgi:ParB-like chromosome segregation protein Spo0J
MNPMPTTMEYHEAANIFPLDEEHLGELADNIRKLGLLVPIETLGGKILDGRRRYLACRKAGVEPRYQKVNPDDPVAYVLALNLERRHLSPTQCAMVGARARKWYDDQAKERMRKGGGDKKSSTAKSGVANLPHPIPDAGKARDKVGEKVGASGKSIDHATKVLKDGTPALIAAADAGLIAVSSAAKYAGQSATEQDAAAERARERVKAGHKPRPRPVEGRAEKGAKESAADNAGGDGRPEVKGVGVFRAREAVSCLQRIPENDALRERGFQIVKDWIRDNR